MSILYHDKDRRSQLTQPQLTRSRGRFRGPRESPSLNLEINQTYYDIARLYARVNADLEALIGYQETLVDGGTVVGAVSITGLESLVERVDRLRSRVAALVFEGVIGEGGFGEGGFGQGGFGT